MTTTDQHVPIVGTEMLTMMRNTLEREHAELINDVQAAAEGPFEPTATTGSGETEHISSGIEQGVQAALDARAITRLADIDDALGRIDNGTYGQCEQCGWAIPIARLEAIPHARLCLACQQDQEVDLRGRQHR